MKRFFCILVSLCLTLLLCVPAFSGNAAIAEGGIPFRFASREEGLELMLANDEYYAKFTRQPTTLIVRYFLNDIEG